MYKITKLFLKQGMPETVLEAHVVKVIKVIASCQTLEQLDNALNWVRSLVDEKDSVSKQLSEAFDLVVLCQYYNVRREVLLMPSFNTVDTLQWNLKVDLPNQSVG